MTGLHGASLMKFPALASFSPCLIKLIFILYDLLKYVGNKSLLHCCQGAYSGCLRFYVYFHIIGNMEIINGSGG